MFTLTRSRSSSSSSSTSSTSPTTPYQTLSPFLSTPLKSSPSPPTTTTTSHLTHDYFSLPLSPPSVFSPASPSSSISTAYPSWPNRASLAIRIIDCNPQSLTSPHHTSSNSSYGFNAASAYPSSYISDEDLLSLDGWRLPGAFDEGLGLGLGEGGISWSATRQPEVVTGEERRRRCAPPVGMAGMGLGRRRARSGSKRRGGRNEALGTIAE